jgi:small subunit ribosomal protein S4
MARAEAKQLINHGHFLVNGKKVDIPSYILEVGDVIDIKADSKESTKIKAILAANDQKPIPSWLDLDKNTCTGRVADLPDPAGIDLPIEVHLIVELYSK